MLTCTRSGLFLLVILLSFLIWPGRTVAQDPIRVGSNEVLVPTVVFDKELFGQLNKIRPHHRDSYSHLTEKNSKLWDGIVVKDLMAKDFHLFEDGEEQRIHSVKLEPPSFRVVEDNLGKHPEVVGSGGGVWGYPDQPVSEAHQWLAWPQYVIGYVPPASAPGSCHQIQVKVSRADLVVWARSQYCNTPHSGSDPLNGTSFGNKLAAALTSGKESTLALKLNAAAFPEGAKGARVYVTMNFPWQDLVYEFRDDTLHATIGTLLMVYKKDGTLVARYSDFACCDYGNETETPPKTAIRFSTPSPDNEAGSLLPDRYETQFALAPGEYAIRGVVSDGVHFGEDRVPLKVEESGPKELAISDV